MKIVSITEVRQDATKVIRHAQQSAEPVLVVRRSKPAAYLVGAAQYEALQAELKQLRRAELLRDVADAEAEIHSGDLPAYQDVGELMASLEADADRSSDRVEQASPG